jgi:hypothetical protein
MELFSESGASSFDLNGYGRMKTEKRKSVKAAGNRCVVSRPRTFWSEVHAQQNSQTCLCSRFNHSGSVGIHADHPADVDEAFASKEEFHDHQLLALEK